jgi:hypothetical protein
MTIEDLIKRLQKIKEEEGNLEVVWYSDADGLYFVSSESDINAVVLDDKKFLCTNS